MAGKPIYAWRTGKNLFEILNQLPNFGVGRVVTRAKFQYFDPVNPSYFRITKVKIDCSRENLDFGEAWGIPTWKGYSQDGLEIKIPSTHKKEWKIIRKNKEASFCHFVPKPDDFKQVPNYVKMPPLLEAMAKTKKNSRGLKVTEEDSWIPFELEVNYKTREYQIVGAKEVMDYGKTDVSFDDITDEEVERTVKFLEDHKKQIQEWTWDAKLKEFEALDD